VLAVSVFLVAIAIALGWWWMRPRLTEEDVRSVVVSTIQRESPASFYVTGSLDIVATVTAENTRYFLPDLFRFNLGTVRSTARVPGRVSYGFDVRQLREQDIRVLEDGTVEITLPELSVYSVEPDLARMEVQTDAGWRQLEPDAGQRQEQRAMEGAQEALRSQAERHLGTSAQPRINTAQAIESLLRPILQAVGMPDPQFRFHIGPRLVIEPAD
jgi:hypothetical protein